MIGFVSLVRERVRVRRQRVKSSVSSWTVCASSSSVSGLAVCVSCGGVVWLFAFRGGGVVWLFALLLFALRRWVIARGWCVFFVIFHGLDVGRDVGELEHGLEFHLFHWERFPCHGGGHR